MRYTRRGSFVLFLGLLAAAAAPAADLTTAGGKKYTGTLVAVDRDGVTFRVGTTDTKITGKEVLVVDLGNKVVPPPKDAKYHEIELTDGTTLRCAKFLVKGKKVEVELLPGPSGVAPPALDLPLASVFYAVRGADDEKNRAEWRKMLQTRGKRDLYVMRQADGLNFVQGTLLEGSADGTTLTFEKEDGTKEPLRLSRATGGLVFSQPPPATVPPTLCKVVDVFGNTLVAAAVEVTAAAVTVTTVAGVRVTYPTATGVAKLDYAQGNIAYLSDLTPQVDVPELPADEGTKTLNVRAPFLADKTPTNEALKLDGIVYPKGLWVAADTVLTYAIGGDYREFRAVVGVHDQFGNSATEAKVTVEADGRVLFAEVVRRKDKPKVVSLDVKNVKTLRVLVESDAPFFNGSQAVLADARVQK